jgi:hypothetical protein
MPKLNISVPAVANKGASPRARLSEAKARQSSKIASLREALVRSGYDTINKQAAILGTSRSTAWYLLNGDYKGSGLSAITIKRILSAPSLPLEARRVIHEYIEEKLSDCYGHDGARLKQFRKRMVRPADPRGRELEELL